MRFGSKYLFMGALLTLSVLFLYTTWRFSSGKGHYVSQTFSTARLFQTRRYYPLDFFYSVCTFRKKSVLRMWGNWQKRSKYFSVYIGCVQSVNKMEFLNPGCWLYFVFPFSYGKWQCFKQVLVPGPFKCYICYISLQMLFIASISLFNWLILVFVWKGIRVFIN